METISIQITNPLARNLISNLEELKLIKILSKDEIDEKFLNTLKKIRAKKSKFTMEEIIQEVDEVRANLQNENNI